MLFRSSFKERALDIAQNGTLSIWLSPLAISECLRFYCLPFTIQRPDDASAVTIKVSPKRCRYVAYTLIDTFILKTAMCGLILHYLLTEEDETQYLIEFFPATHHALILVTTGAMELWTLWNWEEVYVLVKCMLHMLRVELEQAPVGSLTKLNLIMTCMVTALTFGAVAASAGMHFLKSEGVMFQMFRFSWTLVNKAASVAIFWSTSFGLGICLFWCLNGMVYFTVVYRTVQRSPTHQKYRVLQVLQAYSKDLLDRKSVV